MSCAPGGSCQETPSRTEPEKKHCVRPKEKLGPALVHQTRGVAQQSLLSGGARKVLPYRFHARFKKAESVLFLVKKKLLFKTDEFKRVGQQAKTSLGVIFYNQVLYKKTKVRFLQGVYYFLRGMVHENAQEKAEATVNFELCLKNVPEVGLHG
jgi:hypothetical protein